LNQEISDPLPVEEVVSDEEYEELIESGAIEKPQPIVYETYSRHYTGIICIKRMPK